MEILGSLREVTSLQVAARAEGIWSCFLLFPESFLRRYHAEYWGEVGYYKKTRPANRACGELH